MWVLSFKTVCFNSHWKVKIDQGLSTQIAKFVLPTLIHWIMTYLAPVVQKMDIPHPADKLLTRVENLLLMTFMFSSACLKITMHSAGVKFGFLVRFAGKGETFSAILFLLSMQKLKSHKCKWQFITMATALMIYSPDS